MIKEHIIYFFTFTSSYISRFKRKNICLTPKGSLKTITNYSFSLEKVVSNLRTGTLFTSSLYHRIFRNNPNLIDHPFSSFSHSSAFIPPLAFFFGGAGNVKRAGAFAIKSVFLNPQTFVLCNIIDYKMCQELKAKVISQVYLRITHYLINRL